MVPWFGLLIYDCDILLALYQNRINMALIISIVNRYLLFL